MGVVRRALTSASFIEKLTLLLLTGIVVPILIIYFNLSAWERQKALDTNKARDASILLAQSKLLDRRDDLRTRDRFDVYFGMADNRIGAARLDIPECLPPWALIVP